MASPAEVLEGTPDRVFHLEGTQACFDDEGATHTEISEEETARLRRLADNLRDNVGAAPEEVNLG